MKRWCSYWGNKRITTDRPESCLIIPKTLVPFSICCLGYQPETKPHERHYRISAAPARTTDISFLMGAMDVANYSPSARRVSSSYSQWSDSEAAHVVPEDQRALRPSGGDDGGLEVGGVAVAAIWTVCTQIPTLWTASVRGKTMSTEQDGPAVKFSIREFDWKFPFKK